MRLARCPRLSSQSFSARYLHHSAVRIQDHDPEIFPNSLRETLDAHRASNRASLIRFVPPRPPPRRVHHPNVPSENKTPSTPSQGNARPKPTPSQQKPTALLKHPSRICQPWGSAVARHQYAFSRVPFWVFQQLRWGLSSEEGRSEPSPWLVHYPRYAINNQADAAGRLDAEIRALEEYLAPTQDEQRKMDQLTTAVAELLKRITPYPPQVAGSWCTGVASGHSDIDFILPVPDVERSMDKIRKPSPTRPQVLHIYRRLLRKVERTFKRHPMFTRQTYLSEGRIPSLTAIHFPTGRRFHFRCGEGLPSSVEHTKEYLAEYPAVRPLYKATRLILEAQSVFGYIQASISSHALLMLLVAFSKMNHGRFQRPDSLGQQLLVFLHTYGSQVDFTTTGIAVDPPGWFNFDTVRDEQPLLSFPEDVPAHLRGQRSLINLKRTAALRRNLPIAHHLCIQDPANYMNDLGRSCTHTSSLQKAWADAYERLRAAMNAQDSSATPFEKSVLADGLRANFDDFDQGRAALANASKGILR